MAELDVRSRRKSKASYQAVVVNRGPDTVILNKIEPTEGHRDFVAGDALHRPDLELLTRARHEFRLTPSISDKQPLEVDITFTDDSGTRTKTYPIYL